MIKLKIAIFLLFCFLLAYSNDTASVCRAYLEWNAHIRHPADFYSDLLIASLSQEDGEKLIKTVYEKTLVPDSVNNIVELAIIERVGDLFYSKMNFVKVDVLYLRDFDNNKQLDTTFYFWYQYSWPLFTNGTSQMDNLVFKPIVLKSNGKVILDWSLPNIVNDSSKGNIITFAEALNVIKEKTKCFDDIEIYTPAIFYYKPEEHFVWRIYTKPRCMTRKDYKSLITHFRYEVNANTGEAIEIDNKMFIMDFYKINKFWHLH